MNSLYNRKILTSAFAFIFLFAFTLGTAPQNKGALEPENSTEARLNRMQPPDKVMDKVRIQPGMIIAEIGAGRGRYVVHLADRVGETGKVYAEDIDFDDLKYLEKRCQRWGLKNVETIYGDITDPKLPEGELGLIMVVSSYHHFDDPVALLRNARTALKPGGKLAIVEWLPWNENDSEGTPPEEMETQMKAAGYTLERTESLPVEKKLNIYIFRPSYN